jgi:putative Mn2+ efflux pump MntP
MNFERVGGRTFSLVAGCGLACTVLLWFGKLTDPSFTTIILGTVGAYVLKSGFDKHADTRADVQKTLGSLQAASPPTIVEQVPT